MDVLSGETTAHGIMVFFRSLVVPLMHHESLSGRGPLYSAKPSVICVVGTGHTDVIPHERKVAFAVRYHGV